MMIVRTLLRKSTFFSSFNTQTHEIGFGIHEINTKIWHSTLSIQDNLFQASANELLQTDEIHFKDTERIKDTKFLPDSFVSVHFRNSVPPTRLDTHWRGPMKVIRGFNSRHTLLDLANGKEKDFQCQI